MLRLFLFRLLCGRQIIRNEEEDEEEVMLVYLLHLSNSLI